MDYGMKWERAVGFEAWLGQITKHADLWRALARRAQVADSAVARVAALGGRWNLLVLSEDWCGDAVNTLPYIARLAGRCENLQMRVLSRDAHPDVMRAHRTPRPAVGMSPPGGSNSIPVVMALDERFAEKGWWGPRPAPLQHWFWTEGRSLPTPADRYRYIRAWHARDRGATLIEELIRLLEAVEADGGARVPGRGVRTLRYAGSRTG